MAITAAQRVGRTLARLSRLGAEQQADEAPQAVERVTRSKLLELLRQSSQPLTVEAMCTETGLHPNTVRGHLEVLVAAQTVTRERGPAKGRGRPPWLYGAAEFETPESYEELKATLRQQLAEADESTLAKEAAARWADLEAETSDFPITDNDDAVSMATDALNQAGFRATQSFAGDRIEVTSCPYSELVAEHPVICNIHTALLSEVLDRTGQEVSVERMDVWVRPGMCVAHLNRTDITPARIITADELSGERSKLSGKKSKKDQ